MVAGQAINGLAQLFGSRVIARAVARVYALRRSPWQRASIALAPMRRRCVVVVGPPRSGTTVFLNALNSSRDFYLLEEPDMAGDRGQPGFGARFRAFHAENGNLPNKSTALPPVLAHDPPWWAWLRALHAHHPYVGAKIVLDWDNPLTPKRFEHFAAQVFYDSQFIFIFRDPVDMAASMRNMQEYKGVPCTAWADLFAHFVDIVRLYVDMVRLFPNVRAVIHEDITAETFATLGEQLGCDLNGAFDYYRASQDHRAATHAVPQDAGNALRYARSVYDLLRVTVAEGPALAQADQNIGNVRPGHRNNLGKLAILLDVDLLARVVGREAATG